MISELGVEDGAGVVTGQTGGEHSVTLPVSPGRHRGAQQVQAGEPGGGQVYSDQENSPEQEEQEHSCSVTK